MCVGLQILFAVDRSSGSSLCIPKQKLARHFSRQENVFFDRVDRTLALLFLIFIFRSEEVI